MPSGSKGSPDPLSRGGGGGAMVPQQTGGQYGPSFYDPDPSKPGGYVIKGTPQETFDFMQNTTTESTPESMQLQQLIAAQEAERAAREARIRGAMSALDQVFGQRAGAFDEYADTSYDLNRDRLMDERAQRERQLKFALARAGTMGGSTDVDRNAMLDDRFNQSLADARSYADDQAAQLRAQEQAAKSNLMGVASSGNVTGAQIGNMAQGAVGATQSALRSPAVMPNLGSNMAGVADVIGQALNAIGMRQGRGAVPGQDGQFSSFFPRGGNKREEGTVISTG